MDTRNKEHRLGTIPALVGGLSLTLVGAASWLSPTMAADAATPAPPHVVVTSDVPYESANPVLTPGVLDVYAPAEAGAWPVVVMLHGGPPLSKANLIGSAHEVAGLGFVVFAATWGAGGIFPPSYDELLAAQSQAACAVAFARTHAAEYGGDPATTVVFGHSAGANMAALVAFGSAHPSAGCLGDALVGPIDALVTYEGDWVAMARDVPWDSQITSDPSDPGRLHTVEVPSRAPGPEGRDARLGASGSVLRARGG